MKTRVGFVSNSSSSSFVAVVSEGEWDVAFDEVFRTRNKYVARVVKKCLKSLYNRKSIHGVDLLARLDISTEGDYDTFWYQVDNVCEFPEGFAKTLADTERGWADVDEDDYSYYLKTYLKEIDDEIFSRIPEDKKISFQEDF